MVPGKLPSQLEILSTGQNYYETFHWPHELAEVSYQFKTGLQLTSLECKHVG